MNKFFGIVLPYITIALMIIFTEIQFDYKEAIGAMISGILIAFWCYHMKQIVGTKAMKLITLLTFILCAVALALSFVIELLTPYMSVFALWCGLELCGFIFLLINKPVEGMTYGYSYQNTKRRYF